MNKEVCERMLMEEFEEINVEVSCESDFGSGVLGENGVDGSLEVCGNGLVVFWVLCLLWTSV